MDERFRTRTDERTTAHARNRRRVQLRPDHTDHGLPDGGPGRRPRAALHGPLAARRAHLQGRLAGAGRRRHRLRRLDHALRRHDGLLRRRDGDQLRRTAHPGQPGGGRRRRRYRRLRRGLPGHRARHPRHRRAHHRAGRGGHALHRHVQHEPARGVRLRRAPRRALRPHRRGRLDRRALGRRDRPRLPAEPRRQRRHGRGRHRYALHRHVRDDRPPRRPRQPPGAGRFHDHRPAPDALRSAGPSARRRRHRDVRPAAGLGRGHLERHPRAPRRPPPAGPPRGTRTGGGTAARGRGGVLAATRRARPGRRTREPLPGLLRAPRTRGVGPALRLRRPAPPR